MKSSKFKRLPRRPPSSLRAIALMTSKDVVVIVEGGSDLSTYDKICNFALPATKKHLILKSSDFKGISNGKTGVVNLFQKTSLKGLKKVLFIVDKDVDDFCGSKITHNNLCYTNYYNIENELVRGSDFISSLAIVCDETPHTVATWLRGKSIPDLLSDISGVYVTWMTYCLLIRTKAPSSKCGNYGSNRPLFKNCSAGNILRNPSTKGLCNIVKNKMAVSQKQFIQTFKLVEADVMALFSSGTFDYAFNGKWYFPLISDWVTSLDVVSKNKMNGFDQRLRDLMVSHIRSDSPIVQSVRTAITRVS